MSDLKTKLNDLDLKELISYSIEAEEESKQYYNQFKEIGKGKIIEKRFESLIEDEQMHKEILIDLYNETFDEQDYFMPEEEKLPPHEHSEDLEDADTLIDGLERAIENEHNAIVIYEYIAENYEDYAPTFEYLAVMEKGHQESLMKEKTMYERRISDNHDLKDKDPKQFFNNYYLKR